MRQLPAPILGLAILLAALSPSRCAGAERDTLFDRFADSLLAAQLAKHHVPGAVLVVVREGRMAFARGYGFADLERHVTVDPERTVFRLASVSKLFTATAVMQLEEEGRLDLHADVNTYLTRFRVPQAYPRPVRLFDLLTHTAGFDDRNIARKAGRPADVEPLGDYLARSLPPRVRPPGEFIAYSNHGMALAGYLVEVASGMPFEHYLRERIFAPLGMAHSGFELEPPAEWALATGYEGDPPRPVARDYTKTVPASMLSASGADVARFMIAHLEGGQLDSVRILGAAAVDAMHRREFTQHPQLPGIGFGFWERFQNGERAIWHDGDAAGFASLLYLLPGHRTGYFMAFNSRSGNRARREILAALLDREFPHGPAVAPPPPGAGATAEAARCAGTYTSLRHGHRSIEKLVSLEQQVDVGPGPDGSLEIEGVRYVPIGDGVYADEKSEGRIAFRFDRSGRATHLFEGGAIARVSERVPWYETVKVQLGWLLFCVFAFAWCVLDSLIRFGVRLARNRAAAQPGAAARRTEHATVAVSTLNLAFLAGFGLALAGTFGSLEYGIPMAVVGLFTLPFASIALTLAAFAGLGQAWRQATGRVGRARLVVVLAAALAFVAWLACWNLVGFRF